MSKIEPTFKINWVEGPNTKTMKKVFPVLPLIDDEDIILNVDDDFVIPNDYIEIRLNEFAEEDFRFPISGGSNPKWHLNLPLYNGVVYNNVTAMSIFQKKMLANYDKILCDEIIHTYNDDFLYTMLMISNGYWVLPSKKISAHNGYAKRNMM